MKRKNRVFCILFAAALSASVLAGCGNSSNSSSNDSGSSTDVPVQSETQETEPETSQTEPETSGAAQEAVSGESIVTNGGEEIALASLEYQDEASDAVVYYTSDISPQAMLDIYAALGVELTGDNIAVKLSTGEPPASNYLDPNLIADLVHQVDGTIVENNTAYGGQRSSTAMHYQVAEDHGFTDIADFVVLDEDGSVSLPVEGGTRLTENLVGAHFPEYDGYLVLSHFKGHAMAGFGGAIKNISIGLGSQEGKCLIHTAGESHTSPWGGEQDPFTESMYGTIPLAASFSKSGMRDEWLASFMMCSILLNPQLIIYSTALGTTALAVRIISCFFCGIAAGLLIRFLGRGKPFFNFAGFEDPHNHDTDPNLFLRLMKNIGRNIRATGLYFLFGVFLSAVFQRYVPEDLMTTFFGGNEAFGILMAATIGVPLYACGGGTIPLLQAWLMDGMSMGSAAAFMITGPSTKITNLGALKIVLGIRNFIIYIAFVMIFSFATGLVVNLLV